MVTAWPSVFSQNSPLCRAIHIVCKMKAYGKIYYLLSKYLHWHMEPPGDIYRTITSTLKAVLKDKNLTFQKSSWYGDDLCPAAWTFSVQDRLPCYTKKCLAHLEYLAETNTNGGNKVQKRLCSSNFQATWATWPTRP
ncbi:hypothetical protein HF521_016687 [Silurus meridionalis]|uniref:Little elongation complex subunit 1 C-terminal domain-containing protein n=1 Tax=Silurus meridionalis TaxID=175797 RepID=A0A8T0BWH5_SILME|nr:hypothetical protein HF521_016687 [Silurus meridionalis]